MNISKYIGLSFLAVIFLYTPLVAAQEKSDHPVVSQVSAGAFAASERAKRSFEEVVNLHMPRIVKRRLSSEEKAAIPDMLRRVWDEKTWESIQPLMRLAESGDKDAMLALLRAFKGEDETSIYKILSNAPLESWNPREAQLGIMGRWGAEYWLRHGKHPVAFNAIWRCTSRDSAKLFDCGLGYVMKEKQLDRSWKYLDGETKRPPKMKLKLTSAYRSDIEQRATFDTLNAEFRRKGRKGARRTQEWLEGYVTAHPEAAPLLQGTVTAVQEAEASRALARLQYVANMRVEHQRNWRTLWPKASLDTDERLKLEYAASSLGDDYLIQFSTRYILQLSHNINRICALKHNSCRTQSGASNARDAAKAQDIAQADADAYARAGASVRAQSAIRSNAGLVTVRRYDRNGNYLGDTQMTKAQAEIVGAK